MQGGVRTRWAVCSACSWKKCLQRLIELLFISCLFHVWVRSSFPLTYTWGPNIRFTRFYRLRPNWNCRCDDPAFISGASDQRGVGWNTRCLLKSSHAVCLFFSFQHQQRVWVAAWTGSHTRISHSWPKWVLALKWWPTRHSANWGPLLSFGPLD